MKEYRWEARIGIFDIRTLVFIVTDSIEASMKRGFHEYVEKYCGDREFDVRGYSFEWDKQCIILLQTDGGINHRTISHEALHVATGLFLELGVPISRDNDETLAYTQDWIIGKVHDWLKEAGIRIKPFNYYAPVSEKMKITKLKP